MPTELRRRSKKQSEQETSDTGYDSVSDTETQIRKPLPAPTRAQVWNKRWTRFWTSIVMLSGFLLFIYGGPPALMFLVIMLQVGMFREIVVLGVRRRKEEQLPGFNLLHWYWLLATTFFMYGNAMMNHVFLFDSTRKYIELIMPYHTFLSFSFFTLGFVAFVMSLKKNCYRYQFKQFAWCLVTILIVIVQSSFLIVNMYQGLIWFVLPVLLINVNDTMAYVFGVMFGKTPLIKLSPKKTWEGFIGGTFSTIIISFALSYYFQQHPHFVCPKRNFDFEPARCSPDAMYVPYERLLYPQIRHMFEWIGLGHFRSITVSSFQLHAFCLSIFASIVAPFGGFFASGFKRAFKIKDFGDSIPGHGGIADRMDCQITMGMFVYVYMTTFVRSVNVNYSFVLELIKQLARADQERLVEEIQLLLQ